MNTRADRRRKRRAEATRSAATTSGAQSSCSAVLECGHPGRPSNLIGGQCGTCKLAADWERLSKESDTPNLKKLAAEIAAHFRSGNMIYDTKGKTLLEIEAACRPHSNDQAQRSALEGE